MYFEQDILDFIELIRKSVPNSIEIFTQGNCGPFALILSKAFPGGEIKNIVKIGHMIYEYHGNWYDITGQISENYMKVNNIDYNDAKEIFSYYGVGKAMVYLRPTYK